MENLIYNIDGNELKNVLLILVSTKQSTNSN